MRTKLLAVLSALITAITMMAMPPASAATKTMTLYLLQTSDCMNTITRVLSFRSTGGHECGTVPIKDPETYTSERSVKRILSRTGGWATGTIYVRSVPPANAASGGMNLIPDLVGYADVTVGLTVNGRLLGQTQFAGPMTTTEPLLKTIRYKLPASLKGQRYKSAAFTVTWNTSVGHTVIGMSGSALSRVTLPYSTK